MSALSTLLRNTPILQILPQKRTLIPLTAEQTVEACLDVLTQNKLECAPVLRRSGDKAECIGFLDMSDLVVFAVGIASSGDIENDRIDDALARVSKFLSQTAQAVIDANGCQPYHAIDCAASTDKALALMLDKAVNRLGVTRAGTLLSTVTLSDIVNLVARGHSDTTRPDQPIDIPKATLSKTIGEAAAAGQAPFANVGVREVKRGSMKDGVLVVKGSDRLLRCFGGVATDGAVGVVDDNGVLYGNVSAWDLKFINHHSLVSFSLPIFDFLKTVREACMAPTDYLVTVKSGTSLGALLKKFADNHVDRIYVVDEQGKPVGVIDNATLLRILTADK